MPMYPQMFVMPDGRGRRHGPDPTTRIFDPTNGTWSVLGDSGFTGHAAVMYRPGKDPEGRHVLRAGRPCGRGRRQGRNPRPEPDGSPTWRQVTPLTYPRAYLQLTVLPDGNVLATGGESASDGIDLTKAVLPAELWNATTEKWTTPRVDADAAHVPLDRSAPARRRGC